jgi:hypothetical protein
MPIGAFLGGALGVGYSGVTPVLTTSLFPAHVRARAIGVVYHVGALIAAFVPTLIPWLAARTGMSCRARHDVGRRTRLAPLDRAACDDAGHVARPFALGRSELGA